MHEVFGKNGILKEIHGSFEFRAEQVEMSEFILERLCSNENGMVEGGTGIGKTLAYLIPSIVYCVENGKKLAVSTETKALQKQIIDKDIPLVREIIKRHFNRDFKTAVCLGSSNYPCRKRFEILVSAGRFSKDDTDTVESLHHHFRTGEIFTRYDITAGSRLWNKINRETEVCSFNKCPFFSNCIFQKARRQWQNADLLIMNHYLFFANIITGKTYLPHFDVILFDEAHSLEGIASDQLGFDISYSKIMENLNRFYKKNRKNSIVNKFSNTAVRKRAITSINKIEADLNAFFENLREKYLSQKNSIRIREKIEFGHSLISNLKNFIEILHEAEENIEDEALAAEFDFLRGGLFVYLQNLASAVYIEKEDYVYWIEKSGDELLGDVHIKGQPVDISNIMHKEVNSSFDSSLYFSATLTINGDFSFMESRLGIHRHRSLVLSSPFDYSNQVLLFISKNRSVPGDSLYVDAVTKLSAEIVEHLGGNCLMLFTSYKMLNDSRERLSGLIDFPIYAQGQYPANEAIARYIDDDGSILMGTHSFWQGIDLPGDLLRGVILMRLPFSVPDRPDIQARMERIEQQGLNSFYHYQIPNAIIRFKQGFGRLIRNRADRGIVAVLDSRIVYKNYGKLFLRSLPQCRAVYSMEELKSAFSGKNAIVK